MKRHERFAEILRKAEPTKLRQVTFFRSARPPTYSFRRGIFHGQNDVRYGGRYSPPGEFCSLYLCGDHLGCALEVAHHGSFSSVEKAHYLAHKLHESESEIAKFREELNKLEDAEKDADRTKLLERVVQRHEFLREQDVDHELLALLIKEDPQPHATFIATGAKKYDAREAALTRLIGPGQVTANVVDLTKEDLLDALKITLKDLKAPTKEWKQAERDKNWTITQDIGRGAASVDWIDGLLVPCALPEDELSSLIRYPVNLVLFMSDADPSKMRNSGSTIETSEEFLKICDAISARLISFIQDSHLLLVSKAHGIKDQVKQLQRDIHALNYLF